MAAVIGLATLVLTIVWGIIRYYHSAKYEKEKVWNEFKELEKLYRQALASGDPVRGCVATP